jgi:hypothetical protein
MAFNTLTAVDKKELILIHTLLGFKSISTLPNGLSMPVETPHWFGMENNVTPCQKDIKAMAARAEAKQAGMYFVFTEKGR